MFKSENGESDGRWDGGKKEQAKKRIKYKAHMCAERLFIPIPRSMYLNETHTLIRNQRIRFI